jgi:hypothetical protein
VTILLLLSGGLLTGCAMTPSEAAICTGTEALLADHAAALVADGGPMSLVTGQALIATLDAGCGR